MDNTNTKASLHEQAFEFLEFAQLQHRLSSFTYYFTGSFELQVMAWPDIDVNVLYAPSRRSDILSLGADCLRQLAPSWFELRCTEKERDSPGYFFLGFEVHWRNTLWNVDRWFLSKAEYVAGERWLSPHFSVCRGRRIVSSGCESHPANVAPAGTTWGGSRR